MLLLKVFEIAASPIILVLVLTLFLWYLWGVIAPYRQFPSHVWVTEMIFENFTKNPFPKLKNICERHMKEGLCVIWGLEPMLFVFGEEEVKMLVNETAATDKPNLYKLLTPFFLQNGLLVSNGEAWKKQKKIIFPLFYPSKMKEIEPIITKNAISFVEQIDKLNGKKTDETPYFLKAFTLKVIFEVLFGMTSDQFENAYDIKYMTDNISKCAEFICYRCFRPWLYFDFTLRFSSFAQKRIKFLEWSRSVIKQELENIKESICSRKRTMQSCDSAFENYSQRRKPVAELLIEHHLKDPSFTMEDTEAHTLSLIMGGFNTLADSLEWSLFLLGHNQDMQERAYQEIMSVTGGDVRFDNLSEMLYLDCIIKETLRLYPIIPLFGRLLKKDLQCGKYKIPKNTTLVYFPYLLHRNPDNYPDPEEFNPDRFMGKDSKIKPWIHIPFAEGVRSCPSKNFSMMEMKILLAHVLRNFRIVSLDRKEDVVLAWEITLKSADDLRMQFIRR